MITAIILSVFLFSFVVFVIHYESRIDELRTEKDYMKAHILSLESQIQRLRREINHQ